MSSGSNVSSSPIRSSSPSFSSATTANRATSPPEWTSPVPFHQHSGARRARGSRRSEFTVGHVTVGGNTIYATDVAIVSQVPDVAGQQLCRLPPRTRSTRSAICIGPRVTTMSARTISWCSTTPVAPSMLRSIAEGRQSVVAAITIGGDKGISSHLVQAVGWPMPQPLGFERALARSAHNLYDTGAFSIVDITACEDGISDGAQAEAGRMAVNVREVQPMPFATGHRTTPSAGGIFDISNHNSLGGARDALLAVQLRPAAPRGPHLHQPAGADLPLTIREELNPPTELTDWFDTSRRVSIQRNRKLRDAYVLAYGYPVGARQYAHPSRA